MRITVPIVFIVGTEGAFIGKLFTLGARGREEHGAVTETPQQFRTSRWYLVVMWPMFVVLVAGIVLAIVFLVQLIHGQVTHAVSGPPRPLIVAALICLAVGGIAGRGMMVVRAMQQQRWNKAHPDADAVADADTQRAASDQNSIESLGLHWSDTGDGDDA